MNKKDQLKEILNISQKRIKAVDVKNGLLISSITFILMAISLLSNLINKNLLISLIVISSISLIFFIISIVPIFWNKNEKKRKTLCI